MRTRKKLSGLVSAAGAIKLVAHATMGVAMGLAFSLLLLLVKPAGFANLGSPGMYAFVGMLVVAFALGAALTGAVFILTENNDLTEGNDS